MKDNQPRILEMCSGTGTAAIEIAKAFLQKNVVGIDISRKSLERAKEAASRQQLDNIQFHMVKQGVTTSLFDDGNANTGQINTYLICYGSRYWKVSEMIYQILMCMGEPKTITQIREQMIEEYSVEFSEDKLQQIIDVAFVNNGLLEGTESVNPKKKNKHIWGKITLFKSGFIKRFSVLKFFFQRKFLFTCGGIALIWMLYILATYSNSAVIHELVSMKLSDVVLCYVFIVMAGIVHEYGHSVAAMSFGGNPGRIGVGVYIIMPVMFSDVTDVWRLERGKRVIVDLGGIYFQGIFLAICYFLNLLFVHHYIWNIAILLSGFQILSNLNPFIKLDGYWILADYLGVAEIKDSVFQAWKQLLFRKRNTSKTELLTKNKKRIIYIYTVFTGCFYAYFIKMLVQSLVMAVTKFRADIITLHQVSIEGEAFTINNVINYVADRISSFIVLIFFVRIIYGIVKAITHLLKEGRKK